MMPAKKAPRAGPRRARRRYRRRRQPMPPPSPPRSPSPSRAPSPPAPTWCAWTSPTAASPTRCSTISTGRANDPQKSIYDDTGWTFGELGNVQVARVTDVKVLDAAMDPRARAGASARRRRGHGRHLPHQPQCGQRPDHPALPLPATPPSMPPKSRSKPPATSSTAGRSSCATSPQDDLAKAGAELGVRAYAVAAAPAVKTHPVRPRESP